MTLSTIDWLRERHANCIRIAEGKTGKDLDGWLEDARYLADAIKSLEDRAGRCAPGLALADQFDDFGKRCADRAVNCRSTDTEIDLQARASTYQECAGLIRQALR